MIELLIWIRQTLPMDLDFAQKIESKIESLLGMEKEQILEAHRKGFTEGVCFGAAPMYKHQTGRQYFEETYINDENLANGK